MIQDKSHNPTRNISVHELKNNCIVWITPLTVYTNHMDINRTETQIDIDPK